jgi:hypothetical protein
VALVERAIRNSSKSRDIVLDPFGGSGSTLIACEKAGRQARLIELDPKYCDVIVERWQRLTGKTACPPGALPSGEPTTPGAGATGPSTSCTPGTASASATAQSNRHNATSELEGIACHSR